MTALLHSPQLDLRPLLNLERTDIVFANSSPDHVGIEVTVWNRGEGRSEPTVALLQAAPLGAFLPWQPLAVLPVPALEPGEPHVLRAEAVHGHPAPLGNPDRLSPRRLLTALDMDDDRAGPNPNTAAVLQGLMQRRFRANQRVATPTLPADVLEIMRQGSPHWAGNLNVFIGRQAVERHLAQALRVYGGRTNLAMFVVGTGRDAYAFHLAGAGATWQARLFDMTGRESINLDLRKVSPLSENRWIELDGHRMLMLALVPPADCERGTVEVHVEQRSSGQTAVVEFSLDPAAAGPGCYVV
jgi:hypothetical protein